MKRIEIKKYSWSDERGWGIEVIEAVELPREKLGNLHIVSLKPGKIRANHFHPDAIEWMLICGGPTKFAWRSCDDNSVNEIVVNGNEPVVFEIPPNTHHAVQNLSENDIYLMAFNNSYKYNTVRCSPLI